MTGTTDRQARYLMRLLAENGYSIEYMDGGFKRLGARMRERSGRVVDWVRDLGSARASALIDFLKQRDDDEPAHVGSTPRTWQDVSDTLRESAVSIAALSAALPEHYPKEFFQSMRVAAAALARLAATASGYTRFPPPEKPIRKTPSRKRAARNKARGKKR